MPTFEVTGPDGKVYEVTGPAGSTAEQALARVKAQHGGAPQTEDRSVGTYLRGIASGLRDADPASLVARGVTLGTDALGITKGANAAIRKVMTTGEPTAAPAYRGGRVVGQTFGTAPVMGLGAGATSLAGRGAALLGQGAATGAVTSDATDISGTARDAMYGAGAALAGTAAVKGVGKIAPLAGKLVTVPLGVATGAGHSAIEAATKAGFAGGRTGKAFTDNMRGNVPMEDVLTQAKTALGNMRQERSAAYKAGMTGIKSDPTVLDLAPVEAAVSSVKGRGFYKGKAINSSASSAWSKIDELVTDWKASDPAEFHTPEGLDALKKAIGDIRDAEGFGTPARNAADAAYNAVKDQIVKQAPGYAKVMKDYEQASTLLKEIETSLSLGKKASADTALRKLQSVMRNNANTNYGKRADLTAILAQNGAPNLVPALAGQALSAAQPRGLSQLMAGGFAGATALTNPTMLPGLLAASPRVVGEGAYYAGRAAGAVTAPGRKLLNAARGNSQGRVLLNGPQNPAVNGSIRFGDRLIPLAVPSLLALSGSGVK